MIFTTKSPEETEEIGRRLSASLFASGARNAVVAMRGEMGVGKTAFARGFAKTLDIIGVRSPTYTIVNAHRGIIPLYHFDAYRIESDGDLESIGFDEYVYSEGYSLIEWSENIDWALPTDKITVTISKTAGAPDERTIEISGFEGEI